MPSSRPCTQPTLFTPTSSQPPLAAQSMDKPNIINLPTELQTHIHRSLSPVDSFCLGLTHRTLYNIHFSIYGPTGLFAGTQLSKKRAVRWGLECHVRIQDWLLERGFRVGFVTVPPSSEGEREKRVLGLVSSRKWEDDEEAYNDQLYLQQKQKDLEFDQDRKSEVNFLATYQDKKTIIVTNYDAPRSNVEARRFRRFEGLHYLEDWDVNVMGVGVASEEELAGVQTILEIGPHNSRWGRMMSVKSVVVLIDVERRALLERRRQVLKMAPRLR